MLYEHDINHTLKDILFKDIIERRIRIQIVNYDNDVSYVISHLNLKITKYTDVILKLYTLTL